MIPYNLRSPMMQKKHEMIKFLTQNKNALPIKNSFLDSFEYVNGEGLVLWYCTKGKISYISEKMIMKQKLKQSAIDIYQNIYGE